MNFDKQILNKQVVLIRLFLALMVFCATYLYLSPDAITKEPSLAERTESYCVVHSYSDKIETTLEITPENTLESTTEITPNGISEGVSEGMPENVLATKGFESDSNMIAPVATTKNKEPAFAKQAAFTYSLSEEDANDIPSDGVNIDGSVNENDNVEFKIFVDNNGKWVESDTFQNGDSVKVKFHYDVYPNGDDYSKIYYQIPGNVIILSEVDSGDITRDGKVVGSYTIGTNGLIIMEFDPDKIDVTDHYDGDLEFTGSMRASGGNKDKEIHFDKDKLTFDFVDKDNPGTETSSDLYARKDIVGEKDENGYYNYKVLIGSNNGTDGEKIDVDDTFTTNRKGKQHATYDEDSFKVTKVDANGNRTEIVLDEKSLTVNNNNYDKTPYGQSSFTIDDLPALKAGEKYEVTYKAKPDINYGNTSSTGEMLLTNKVDVSGGDLKDTAYENETLSKPTVNKKGEYDEDDKTATWEITIVPDGKDLTGYKVKDTVTSSDGTTITIPNAKLTRYKKDGKTETVTIDLPYTFKDADKNCEKYVINYETDLSELKPNQDVNVTNKVEILDDEEDKFLGTGTGLPTITETTYDVKKVYNEDGAGDNIYNWTTTIDVPKLDEITGNLICTDTINTTLTADGPQVQNAHYTTVEALRAVEIYGDNNLIDPSNYDITITTLDGKWYSDFNIDNEDIPPTQQVKVFTVTFEQDYVKTIANKRITFDYHTFIDTEETEVGNTYVVENTATVGNKDSIDNTTYPKAEGIDKESKINGTGYNKAPQSYDYEIVYDETLKCAVMTYRVKFITSVYNVETQLKQYKLTDTLPEGAYLLPWNNNQDNEVNVSFVCAYGSTGSFWGNGKEYSATDYITYEKTTDENNVTKVEFKLTGKYFEDYDALKLYGENHTDWVKPLSFYMEYKIALPAPEDWDEENEKTFINNLTYGGENVQNEVTLKSDQEFVSKIGVQENETDADGNPVLDKDGKPKKSNKINYSIVVNKAGVDLLTTKKTVVLTDTLKFVGSSGSTAKLDPMKFRVYEYDPDAEDNKGAQLTTDEYKYITETKENGNSTSYIFKLTIPDNIALLVEYTYEIDGRHEASSRGFKIENIVEIQGVETFKDETKLQVDDLGSFASVNQQSLTLLKYDVDNEAKHLAGATFEFFKWVDKDGDGTYAYETTKFGTNSRLTTGEDGTIEFDLRENGVPLYDTDVLYRFSETDAPEGYRKDTTLRYFVFIGDPDTDDLLDYVHDNVAKPNWVYLEDIIFIVNDSAVLPIPNEKSTLHIEKEWFDTAGNILGDDETPDSIDIDLYRHETKPAENHTVTVTSTAIDKTTSGGNPAEQDVVKTLDLAPGSDLLIKVINSGSTNQNFYINNGYAGYGYQDPENANVKCFKIENITADMTVRIEATDARAETFDFYFFEFTKAKYVPTGEAEFVGTYTLNKVDDWSREWLLLNKVWNENNLLYSPVSNNSNPYYYFVKESSVPVGCTVTYSDSNIEGVSNGTITITNTKDKYTLPSTGGENSFPYQLGVGLIMAAAIVYNQLTKREVR